MFHDQMFPVLANSPLCETCSDLDLHQIFSEGVHSDCPIKLGILATILSKKRTCGLCRLVSLVISRSWCLELHPTEDLTSVEVRFYASCCGYEDLNQLPQGVGPLPTCAHRIYLEAERPSAIHRMVMDKKIRLQMQLQMMEESAARFGRERAFHGRRVETVVSMKRIKEWMRICEKEHGAKCADVWRYSNVHGRLPQSARMIDVDQMAIVEASQDCIHRYVALSYVWGNVNTEYKTVSLNLAERRLRGALESVALPSTICDAIKVVRELGEKYLWVDALCIVQDNPDDRKIQIEKMHLIYGLAELTIVAAGGNYADASLPGLKPRSHQELQHIERIQSLSLAMPLRMLDETMAESVWNTRGWTYQEAILSRRKLFFTNEQLFFQCQCQVFSEDVIAESSKELADYPGRRCNYIPRFMGSHSLKGVEHRDIEKTDWSFIFQQLIESYTRRLLTNPADIYDAIFAIITMFFAHLPDVKKGFLFGMPAMVWDRRGHAILEHAMLWQPGLRAPAHARRHVDTELVITPSWSWAGWEGSITYGISSEQLDGFLDDSQNASVSLVDEWIIGDMDGRARRISTRRHLQTRDTTHEIASYLGPSNSGASLVDEGDSLAPGMLLFRTTAASLKVRRIDLPVNTNVQLERGRRLHYDSMFHSVFEIFKDTLLSATMGRIVLPSDTDTTMSLEFVVLSCSSLYHVNSDTYDSQMFGNSYVGCLLNVMAVKTANGTEVSERLGVGVIVEPAWVAAGIQDRVVQLQ